MTKNISKQQIAKEIYVGLLMTGNNRYGYFAVRSDKVDEFRKLIATDGAVKLPEYALLVEEGMGEPSTEVKKRLEEKYNFSHDFINDLRKQAAA